MGNIFLFYVHVHCPHVATKLARTSKCLEVQELSKYCVVLLRRPRHNIIWHLVITNGLIMQFLSLNCPNINNGFLPPPDLFMASAGTFIEVSSRSYWRVKAFHVLLTAHRTRDWLIKCKIGDYFLASVRSAFCPVHSS